MNAFSYLDSMFPTGADRACGEVVSIWVSIPIQGQEFVPVIGHKRKAWYVNASVNAWHLHRSLCRQFKELCGPTRSQHRKITRALRALVGFCYEENFRSDQQYFEVTIDPETGDWAIPSIGSPSV